MDTNIRDDFDKVPYIEKIWQCLQVAEIKAVMLCP